MASDDYAGTEAAALEHRFWLQILGDHARFFYHSLSSTEPEEIQRAHTFIIEFDRLLDESRQSTSIKGWNGLTQRAMQYVRQLKQFKLHLLQRQLVGKIDIMMIPTFISHMVNELEEYEVILRHLQSGRPLPPAFSVHFHLLWQSDAIGHASALISSFDMVEKTLIEQSRTFQKEFEANYLKVLELARYHQRTHLRTFPSLDRFDQEAEQHMRTIMMFLEKIDMLHFKGELLGTLNPLFPDHMLREECYYLLKLAQVAATPAPLCDPARPRKIELK